MVASRDIARSLLASTASAPLDLVGRPSAPPPPELGVRTPPTARPLPVVLADVRAIEFSTSARAAKRAIDVGLSAVGLVVLAPLMAAVALLVKLTSRGPAFFVQERCGLGGRTFRFYKFRTMVADAETRKADLEHLNEMNGPIFKIRKDPRITRVGVFLRKSSIDELPQLWNVLKGDMSLVGPRPPITQEVERYDSRQAQRLAVLPGITGLWQVSGRSALTDFDRCLELDLDYVSRWNVWLDVRILFKTVVVVILARGAQ